MLAGDESAFDGFFGREFPRLYRFALSRLGKDPAAAEEVAQATLCRAVAKLESYRAEATLFAWLSTICRHEISDHLHRQARYVAMEEEGSTAGAGFDWAAAARPDHPEATARRLEVSGHVHTTLEALPDGHAEVLEWKYLLGLSVREIADRLGVGIKAAESRLSRARKSFREVFDAVAGGLIDGKGRTRS